MIKTHNFIANSLVNNLAYVYFFLSVGPLTYCSAIHLMAFLSNNGERAREDLVDHQIYFVEINSLFIKANILLKPEVTFTQTSSLAFNYLNISYWVIGIQIYSPKSCIATNILKVL